MVLSPPLSPPRCFGNLNYSYILQRATFNNTTAVLPQIHVGYPPGRLYMNLEIDNDVLLNVSLNYVTLGFDNLALKKIAV